MDYSVAFLWVKREEGYKGGKRRGVEVKEKKRYRAETKSSRKGKEKERKRKS